jgi:hypothetical protein
VIQYAIESSENGPEQPTGANRIAVYAVQGALRLRFMAVLRTLDGNGISTPPTLRFTEQASVIIPLPVAEQLVGQLVQSIAAAKRKSIGIILHNEHGKLTAETPHDQDVHMAPVPADVFAHLHATGACYANGRARDAAPLAENRGQPDRRAAESDADGASAPAHADSAGGLVRPLHGAETRARTEGAGTDVQIDGQSDARPYSRPTLETFTRLARIASQLCDELVAIAKGLTAP